MKTKADASNIFLASGRQSAPDRKPTRRQIEQLNRILARLEAWQQTIPEPFSGDVGEPKHRLMTILRRMEDAANA